MLTCQASLANFRILNAGNAGSKPSDPVAPCRACSSDCAALQGGAALAAAFQSAANRSQISARKVTLRAAAWAPQLPSPILGPRLLTTDRSPARASCKASYHHPEHTRRDILLERPTTAGLELSDLSAENCRSGSCSMRCASCQECWHATMAVLKPSALTFGRKENKHPDSLVLNMVLAACRLLAAFLKLHTSHGQNLWYGPSPRSQSSFTEYLAEFLESAFKHNQRRHEAPDPLKVSVQSSRQLRCQPMC